MMMDPLWKYLPASLAHRLAPIGVSFYSQKFSDRTPIWKPFTWKNLYFPNRLGLAGGVDKNGERLQEWARLGAGFIEIGTVTPYSQNANPGKIIDRDWNSRNLWNKMGFPNHGSEDVYFNLLSNRDGLKIPVFVNIGKNRSRPNEEAELDYLYLVRRFHPLADAFVINVSSPNTQGLRDLQGKDQLKSLTKKVTELAGEVPVFVKLSPDLSEHELKESIDACMQSNISGFTLTNTTLSRPNDSRFPKEGGLSGKNLSELSKKSLGLALQHLGSSRKNLLMTSVGGVLNFDDVKERLDMGADLVQCYSALVFEGPLFFRQVAKQFNGAHHD